MELYQNSGSLRFLINGFKMAGRPFFFLEKIPDLPDQPSKERANLLEN